MAKSTDIIARGLALAASTVAKSVKSAITALTSRVTTIEGKIPNAASATNQLADKSYVNTNISTNSATFIGTFASVADLEAYSGTLTNNDYAFVTSVDASGNTVYSRYNYVAASSSWVFVYAINNPTFDSDQWAAINSAITAALVEKLIGVQAGAEVNVIDTVKVNDVALTPVDKAVNITVTDGEDGYSPTVSVVAITGGTRVTITDANGDHVFDVMNGEKGATGSTGATGATGNGISSITKTSTSGLTDVYTISFTNGTSTTFNVVNGAPGTNGRGIASISKTSTSGLVDTYTVSYTDSSTPTTFTVTNGAKGDTGRGISSISKTSTSGLVDTYTVSYTDGSTPTTFTVTNGQNGTDGANGNTWTCGTAVTTNGQDTPAATYTGDLYLNTLTWNIYRWDGAKWVYVGNIKGATGSTGATGNGISSISKTGTSGLTDVYTISFTNGTSTTFNVVNGAKGDTGVGITSIVKTATVDLVDTYTILFSDNSTTTFTVTNGKDGATGLPAITSSDNGDLVQADDGEWVKVDPDEVTVGNAKQITSKLTLFDNSPYNFRSAGGSLEIGDRVNEKAIVGASYYWNQHAKADANIWTALNVTAAYSDQSITLTSTVTGVAEKSVTLDYAFVTGHVYYLSCYAKKNDSGFPSARMAVYNSSSLATIKAVCIAETEDNKFGATVYKSTDASTEAIKLRFANASAQDSSVTFDRVMVIDLTDLFGKVIANYISGLEDTTAGVGVAWFRRLFPRTDYAYNAGEWLSVNAGEKISVGFNAYNPSTGKAKVVGSLPYAIEGTYTSFTYANADGDTVSVAADESGYYTFPTQGELTFVGGNASNLCVHLVWDGERNGEFEAYSAHTYAFDPVSLPGVLLLDENRNLYSFGDTYENDGTTKTKVHSVDLGTLNWGLNGGHLHQFSAPLPTGYDAVSKTVNARCLATYDISADDAYNDIEGTDNALSIRSQRVWIVDTRYDNGNDLKTALSGATLIYELLSPSTSSNASYTETQIVANWGTEQLTDYAYSQGSRDVEIPVGHSSDYLPDLRGKLEAAPDSPQNDGRFLMSRQNGKNSYTPYTDPALADLAEDSEHRTVTDNEIAAWNAKYDGNNPPPYPVTSVNGMDGDVTIPDEIYPVTITIVVDPSTMQPISFTMDHTIAEIDAAATAGKTLTAVLTVYGLGDIAHCTMCAYQTNPGVDTYGSFNVWAAYDDGFVMLYSGTTNDGTNTSMNLDINPFDIPTAVSELQNDSGYQTASDVSTAINNAIGNAIGGSY